jgi:C1A family cysteine protease
MGGMEAWAKRNKNVTLDLSENYAFERFMNSADRECDPGVGFKTWKSGVVLSDKGVCNEMQMPYTTVCPTSVPAVCKNNDDFKFKEVKHFFTPKYGGIGSLRADNVNLLEAWLNAGFDIVYGVEVAGTDWGDGTLRTGIVDVQVDANGDPAPSVGGHSMVLIGYNRVQDYLIFKNSWGANSGHAGFVYLSYDYVETYGKYGYAVMDVKGPGL